MVDTNYQHTNTASFEAAMLHMLNNPQPDGVEKAHRPGSGAEGKIADKLQNQPGAGVAGRLQEIANFQKAIVAFLKPALTNMSQRERSDFRQQASNDPAKFLGALLAAQSFLNNKAPSVQDGGATAVEELPSAPKTTAGEVVNMLMHASAVSSHKDTPELARALRLPEQIDEASKGLPQEPQVSESVLMAAFAKAFK